jgi:hypothetical protein
MIPLSVSEKLLRLAGGEQLPASTLKHAIVDELIAEGIILERISGRTKRTLYITDTKVLDLWLYNRHTIDNLSEYIAVLKNETATRADLVLATNDSKTQSKRTYKGFLVNSYEPVTCTLNGQPFIVHPQAGTFQFIYDFETFIPATDVTIVGIENMENFRFVDKQAYLFQDIKPLFVSRYPQEQGKDLMKWLLSIPNKYLHFGDYDFAGINIYLSEYKKHLNERASFFIPANIEELLNKYGKPKLYDTQQLSQAEIVEDGIKNLIALLHKHKRGLEQEVFLIGI